MKLTQPTIFIITFLLTLIDFIWIISSQCSDFTCMNVAQHILLFPFWASGAFFIFTFFKFIGGVFKK